MSTWTESRPLSRRVFLKNLAAGIAGAPLLAPVVAGAKQTTLPAKPYPFKLGLQSYSLRSLSLDEALAKTKELGLKWWEGFPGHLPLTDDTAKITSYRQALDGHGVKMISYGVVDFSNDEADARKKFEFAKAMGIETITASPKPDALSLLDKLTAEYGINIGIHNHGPEDEVWGDWQKISDSVQSLNPRVGACVDTGHYLRSEKNPITAALKFGPRLYSVHMKAVEDGPNRTKVFVPIGTTGNLLDVVQLLRFMKEKKYAGILAIEEEDPSGDPVANVAKSVEAMRRFISTANHVTLKPGS